MLTLVPTREINYSTPFSFLFVQKWLFSHRNRQEALLFVQTNPGGLKACPSRGAFPPPSDHGRICGREFWAGYCFGSKEVICLVNTYEDRLARATASLGLAPENTLPRVFFFFAQKWLLQLPFRQGPLIVISESVRRIMAGGAAYGTVN